MRLRIAATWLQTPPGIRAPELAATWGSCEISVDNRTVTLVEDSLTGFSRRYVVGSLYPLAEWIAYNWWPLQYDFRAAETSRLRTVPAEGRAARTITGLNINQAGDGFAWPSLWIAPTASGSLMTWDSTETNGRVRFVSAGYARVDTDELMETLARFVEQVVDRLGQEGITDTPLHKEWNSIRDADHDEVEFYRSAARLGLVPFDVDPSVSTSILEAFDLLEPQDFDVLMSSAESSRLGRDIEWINRAGERLGDYPASTPDLKNLLGDADLVSPGGRLFPWRVGYEAAALVRGQMGVAVDDKLDLDHYVHVSVLDGPDPGLLGVAGCGSDFAAVVLGAWRGVVGQRFVQARSI